MILIARVPWPWDVSCPVVQVFNFSPNQCLGDISSSQIEGKKSHVVHLSIVARVLDEENRSTILGVSSGVILRQDVHFSEETFGTSGWLGPSPAQLWNVNLGLTMKQRILYEMLVRCCANEHLRSNVSGGGG